MNIELPLIQVETLLDETKSQFFKLKETAPKDINQQDYLDKLVPLITQTTGITLKQSRLYKKLLLPASKEKSKITIDAEYIETLAKFVGYTDFKEFAKKFPATSSAPLFDEDTYYTAFTYESSLNIQRFRFAVMPSISSDKSRVRLESVRNKYFGEMEEKNNNLFIELHDTEEKSSSKTNVVLFIGSNRQIQKQADILLGVYTQINREGKPVAARAVFVKEKKVSSFSELPTAEIISEFDDEYLNVPTQIRRYLFSRKENIIKAIESQAFKLDDLKEYGDQSAAIAPYSGYYKLYFSHNNYQLSLNRMQILPTTGRVYYRSTQRSWQGYAEKRNGNLFIELTPVGGSEKAYLILFVGSEPTLDRKIVFKGVFTTINTVQAPFAGRVVAVFSHKESIMKRLFDEEYIKEYATKRMTKEEVAKDESVELWNYLQPLEKNEVEIGKVRHFDFEDLKE